MTRFQKRPSGFVTYEWMTVTAILAIVAAVLYPIAHKVLTPRDIRGELLAALIAAGLPFGTLGVSWLYELIRDRIALRRSAYDDGTAPGEIRGSRSRRGWITLR